MTNTATQVSLFPEYQCGLETRSVEEERGDWLRDDHPWLLINDLKTGAWFNSIATEHGWLAIGLTTSVWQHEISWGYSSEKTVLQVKGWNGGPLKCVCGGGGGGLYLTDFACSFKKARLFRMIPKRIFRRLFKVIGEKNRIRISSSLNVFWKTQNIEN